MSGHTLCTPAVSVTCEAPFQPADNYSVVCSDGTWLQAPRCVPAKCTELPDAPRNGMVVAPNMEHGMVGKFEVGKGNSECPKIMASYIYLTFIILKCQVYFEILLGHPVLPVY